MNRRRGDEGFATMVVVGLTAVLLGAGGAATALAAAVQTHARAGVAADAAALAGAVAVSTGGDVCGRAAHLAALNRGRLTGCGVEGPDVTVEVAVTPPAWLGWAAADAVVKARAGPADQKGDGTNTDEPGPAVTAS
jgi:secretion/DNA translocation related TadE-like protein